MWLKIRLEIYSSIKINSKITDWRRIVDHEAWAHHYHSLQDHGHHLLKLINDLFLAPAASNARNYAEWALQTTFIIVKFSMLTFLRYSGLWFMMLLPLNVYLFNTLHQYWYCGHYSDCWRPTDMVTRALTDTAPMLDVQWSPVTWQCVTLQTGKNWNRITRPGLEWPNLF